MPFDSPKGLVHHQDWHSPKWSHFVTQWSLEIATTVRYENSTTDPFLFLDYQTSTLQSPSRCFHRNFRNFPQTDLHKREQSDPETMACIGNSTPSSRHFAWRKPWPLMFRFFRARREVLKSDGRSQSWKLYPTLDSTPSQTLAHPQCHKREVMYGSMYLGK